jgi:hypothetical protein
MMGALGGGSFKGFSVAGRWGKLDLGEVLTPLVFWMLERAHSSNNLDYLYACSIGIF